MFFLYFTIVCKIIKKLSRNQKEMRKFDLFPKVADDNFDVRTKAGGIISLLTFLFMFIITIVEINEHSKVIIKQRPILDQSDKKTQDPISIFFNITVAYPCQLLQIKIQDISGNHQIDFAKKITRQRLDSKLNPIASPISDDNSQSIFNSCGNCYGSNYSKCCTTCFDIASSFILQEKLVPNLDNLEQCVRDKKSIDDKETCRLYGELTTSFSKGQILVNAGGQIPLPVHYKYDLTYFGTNVNLSHWINTFRFGPEFDGLKNPLDNSRWLQRGHGFYFYRYSLNLVKTITKNVIGNQYSASFNQYKIEKTVSKRHPSIAFDFDTSPIAVQFSVEKRSFLTFLTSLFAILGGGFTIGSLIDSIVFHFNKRNSYE